MYSQHKSSRRNSFTEPPEISRRHQNPVEMDRQRYLDTARRGLVTVDEVQQAPMEDCHKELALHHFRRLMRVLDADDTDAIGGYTKKRDAREQLARMTLVIRDYNYRHAKGEVEDEVESMIADVVDASFYVSGKEGTWTQPTFVNPFHFGREQEVADLMQEIIAQGRDDVTELWHARSPAFDSKVLPDTPEHGEDLIADIDWDRLSRRSISDNDITYHYRKSSKFGMALGVLRGEDEESVRRDHEPRLSRPERAKALLKRSDNSRSLKWPPVEASPLQPKCSVRSMTDLRLDDRG